MNFEKFEVKSRNFYGLPIHKSKENQDAVD